jgi:hypothetical protein
MKNREDLERRARNKILTCIVTSETYEHLSSCRRMIESFKILFNRTDKSENVILMYKAYNKKHDAIGKEIISKLCLMTYTSNNDTSSEYIK